MKDYENLHWTMENIAHQYKIENPNWTWKQCWKKAKEIYRELNKMNRESFKDTDKFFRNNTPFSFFDNKDDEFGNIFWDGNS